MKLLVLAVSLLGAAAWAKPVVLLSAPKPLVRPARAALAKATVKPAAGDFDVPPSPKSVRDACAAARADVLVQLELGRKLTVIVSRCSDGEVEAMQGFPAPRGRKLKKLKKLPGNVQAMVKAAVDAASAAKAPAATVAATSPDTTPTPPEKPADTEKPSETATAAAPPADDGPPEPSLDDGPELSVSFDDDEEKPDTAQGAGQRAVVIGVGARAFRRSYAYAQDTMGQWGTYQLPVGWTVIVDAAWYPGAHVVKGALAHLGVFGQADLAVGLKSRQDTAVYATDAERFRFGLMGRLPFSLLTLEARLGWARSRFAVAPFDVTGTTPRPRMPDVVVGGPRALLTVRLGGGGPLWGEVSGGALLATDLGELKQSEYFPDASAFAWEAQGAVAWGLAPNLAARLTLDVMNASIATGTPFGPATEWTYGGGLSLVWVQ